MYIKTDRCVHFQSYRLLQQIIIWVIGMSATIQKLQRVQNSAARLVFEESKFCYITALLKSLHWFPVKYRIDFKVLLLTFKAIHGFAPPYISELISVKDANGRYSLRSNNGILLNYPTCKSFTIKVQCSMFYEVHTGTIPNQPPFLQR